MLALADGTIVTVAVADTGTSFNPSQRFLHIIRCGPNGSVISARRLSMDLGSTTFDAIALPDSSVVIGRTLRPSVATLVRLLPNDRFDDEFGGAAAENPCYRLGRGFY